MRCARPFEVAAPIVTPPLPNALIANAIHHKAARVSVSLILPPLRRTDSPLRQAESERSAGGRAEPQKVKRALIRRSRPASGAKSLRKLACRRASTSKMLFAESRIELPFRSPNGWKASEALTIV